MTPAQIRNGLENKILELFEIAEEPPLEIHKENGLGKGDIKRILELDDDFTISINTVKSVVDDFVKRGTIERINPEQIRGLAFRLQER